MLVGKLNRKREGEEKKSKTTTTTTALRNDFDHFRLCIRFLFFSNDAEQESHYSRKLSRNNDQQVCERVSRMALTMHRLGCLLLLLLPLCTHSCTPHQIEQSQYSTDVIFTGRILSLQQWSIDRPSSGFIWVSRILRGEARLLEHYQWTHVERPLYVIVDNLAPCADSSPLKYDDMKIFGVRIVNARFYSSFAPLTITVAQMKAIDGKISSLIDLRGLTFCFVSCSPLLFAPDKD